MSKPQKRAPTKNPKGQEVQSGLLMMVDIERFSGRPAREQLGLVLKLGEVLGRLDLVSRKATYGAITNSTGDGCLVAFQKSVPEAAVIAMACDAIEQMRNGTANLPSVGLRVGLHRGSFVVTNDPLNGNLVAIGTGPNLCNRVMGFADAGYVAASEAFCSHWESELGDQALTATSDFSRPFLVYAKHEFPLRIRIYNGRRATHGSKLPGKILGVLAAELEIVRVLGQIESRYLSSIEEVAGPAEAAKQMSARVSLFAYQVTDEKRTEGSLEPTVYRYHHKDVRPSQGGTHYPVKDPATSPQAKAFSTGHAKAVNGLPDPDVDRSKYDDALREHGFSSDNLASFSRRARSFLCFPFGRPSAVPLGVVCVDTPDPFSNIERQRLEKIGEGLRSAYSSLLAALWTERVK